MADEVVETLFSPNEISEENNLKWLGKVSKERNSTSVPEELVSYVKNLSFWMKYKVTVQESLGLHPTIIIIIIMR